MCVCVWNGIPKVFRHEVVYDVSPKLKIVDVYEISEPLIIISYGGT